MKAASPVVPVIAPLISNLAVHGARLSGRMSGARMAPSIPSGTLMKKTQGQPGPLVSSPPRSNPETPPTGAAAPHHPRARLRSGPSGKMEVSFTCIEPDGNLAQCSTQRQSTLKFRRTLSQITSKPSTRETAKLWRQGLLLSRESRTLEWGSDDRPRHSQSMMQHRGSVMRRRRTVPNEKELDGLYLWRKDSKNENDPLIKAGELEEKAGFGRLEEPLIVAPILEARRGNSHCGKTPSW